MSGQGGTTEFHSPTQVSASLLPFSPCLVPVYLAECAWIYLVLCSVLAASNPGAAFSPAAVLAPYGIAALATALFGLWARWVLGEGRCDRSGMGDAPTLGSMDSEPASQSSELKGIMVDLATATLNLLLGIVGVAAVVWWEMYRHLPPLDLSWVGLAMEEAQGYSNTVAPLVWLVGLGTFLWWRGTRLVQEGPELESLVARFFWGIVALLALVGTVGTVSQEDAPVSWLLAGYLLFGLMAVAMARLESTQRERLGGVDGGWQWRSTLLALLLLAAGFGVALLLLPQLGELARWLKEWLAEVLLPAMLELLKWIGHLLGLDRPPEPLPATPEPVPGPQLREGPRIVSPPAWLGPLVRRLFDLVLIAILVAALYLWVRQWRWDRRRRSGWSSGRERLPWGLRFDLRAILMWPLRALLARWPWLARWLSWAVPQGESGWTVRALYRRLLAWGASRGVAREPWETPREYLLGLSARWPALEADFRALTESYLRTRYGGLPTTAEELADTAARWLRITKQVERAHRR